MPPTIEPTPTPPYPIKLPPQLADTPYQDLAPIWQTRIYRAIIFARRAQANIDNARTGDAPPSVSP